MEKIINQYFPFIDVLKGISILLMVMAHTLAWSYSDTSFLNESFCNMTTLQVNASFVWKLIYSFHMPLLFFVSGFLFYKSTSIFSWDYTKKVIVKKGSRLLIPYFFTGFFILFLRGYFGYWFLLLLFIVTIIATLGFLIINSINNKNILIYWLIHGSILAILLALSKYLRIIELPKEFINFVNLPIYYLSFVVGCWLKRSKKTSDYICSNWVGLMCIILFIVIYLLVNYNFKLPFSSLFLPLLMILFLYTQYNQQETNTRSTRILTLIGKNSLEIYLLHIFFVMPFKEIGSYICKIDNLPFSITLQLSYSLVISFIAIFFSIILSSFLKRNALISKLFFGT